MATSVALDLGRAGTRTHYTVLLSGLVCGRHAHGFPTFVTLAEKLRGKGIGLVAIQTAFEGSEVNTFDRLRESIPVGHAVANSALVDAVPAIMEAYRYGGTPWFVVIAPNGRVVRRVTARRAGPRPGTSAARRLT